ncbi:DNA-binding response regulator [Saccharibacillus sp. O23]|uniref:response regulator transcription factor n=1 Tax=Saccharibacillus sp. O23 TaxID=2009338 RepID=UPI000B4E4766|nr:response regulator transcription factor [Saccharibacillus sp. O23]OWR31438.1 DNA-binding response regulator [Saccharibacillus sp. O23]
MNQSRKIVVIEDERDISRIVKNYMEKHGLEVAVADNGADGLHMIDLLEPDYVILDLTLPDTDGLELCRRIRQTKETPILILSARGSDTDKVLGLGFGADDYMTKPFSLSELLARINAYFRRHDKIAIAAASPPERADASIRIGELSIEKTEHRVRVRGQDISLSAKEFDLLLVLAENLNRVFSKTELLDKVWGYDRYVDDNTVSVYVRRVREKIEDQPSDPRYLKTVWGVGYKLCT